MNVRNCRSCGRIFNYVVGLPLCQVCREKMEDKFQEVKEYVRENPGVGIAEVSEACEVEAGQIRQWLREDRLELTSDSPIRLSCEGCGEQIRSGKFCDKCKAGMINGLNDAMKKDQPKAPQDTKKQDKENPKMRFLR